MAPAADGNNRRGLLSVPMQLVASCLAEAAETVYENLAYRAGRLSWSGGSAAAAAGRGGIRSNKREGDGATPAGTYPLVYGFYREGRVRPRPSALPMRPLMPEDAWVDDPADANYNRLVSLPYTARTEHLWRDDEIYDLIVVIGYNMEPVIPGSGSAIFLHIARPDFSNTEGCIAVRREVLISLIPLLGPGSMITINA
jgi:L,D-peptidoglycan transpeptidase YkuD (ErfK/YbiS/YcfS/YnhG family)